MGNEMGGMTEVSYEEFLARRKSKLPEFGRDVGDPEIGGHLFPFQSEIVKFACKVGRPAVWADTGLGKTRMMLTWCSLMGNTTLIVAPLAVADQTVSEAHAIGMSARYVRDGGEVDGPGIYVTNYEMIEKFDHQMFDAVALDEASILKNSDGKTRTRLIAQFRDVQYRSAWTATPAPNDPEELTSQAEFLGHSTRTNMLAAYFVHDQDGWRLKGHAIEPMLDWMSQWAIAVRSPSDLGFSDDGYILPGLDIRSELVESDIEPAEGELFAVSIGGVSGRSRVRRETLDARVKRAVQLVESEPDEPWVLWVGMNAEGDALEKAIPGAVQVHGSQSPEEKARLLRGFADGDIRVLITKPKIASFGLNWQHCARVAFVGIGDSYEQYYQAIRRCYRFGQKRVVRAHVIVSELEDQIANNVARKEKQANGIVNGMVQRLRRNAA